MASRSGFTSHLRKVIQIQHEIARAALTAAALVVTNEAKMNARGGFKSGRFVTQGWTSITFDVSGVGDDMTARVGSTLKHFMYWEMGHHNVFTGKYERREWLLPAVMFGRPRQQIAALRAAGQVAARYGMENPLRFTGLSKGSRGLPG